MTASRCSHKGISFRNRSLTVRLNSDHGGLNRDSKQVRYQIATHSRRTIRKLSYGPVLTREAFLRRGPPQFSLLSLFTCHSCGSFLPLQYSGTMLALKVLVALATYQ